MARAPTPTEEVIVEVALRLFGSQGYTATSMEQVRREAGVSNGSLYHLFPHKAALAARLFCDGMLRSQAGLLSVLRMASSAEEGVRGSVSCQAAWVDDHIALARLVYTELPDEVLLAASPFLDGPARSYVQEADVWLRHHIQTGAVVDRPFAVSHALWLGPTQEFCRHWLRGRSKLRPRQVATDLAEGAWKALASS
jgi:AcrR family transcriptional regulator